MRPEKLAIVEETRRNITSAEYIVLTDCIGLTVMQMSALRQQLRESGARCQVVKNTTFVRAAAEEEWAQNGFAKSLEGPSAMVWGQGDVTTIAKILKQFAKANTFPKLKMGILAGQFLDGKEVNALADLPSREQLIAQVVCTVAAPLSQLVGVMSQKVASLVQVLKALEEKKGEAAS